MKLKTGNKWRKLIKLKNFFEKINGIKSLDG